MRRSSGSYPTLTKYLCKAHKLALEEERKVEGKQGNVNTCCHSGHTWWDYSRLTGFSNGTNVVSNVCLFKQIKQLSIFKVSAVFSITCCCLPITKCTIQCNYITDSVVRKRLIWFIHYCGAVVQQVMPLLKLVFNWVSVARCQTVII